MKINTDLIIKPGKQEKYNIEGKKKVKVCEDYGVKSNKGQIPMIVISDGCSSQDFSDWGSRILTMEYFNFLQNGINLSIRNENIYRMGKINNESVYFLSRYDADKLGLSLMILNATISILYIFNEYAYVNIINDGYLIVGYKSGQIEVNKFEYLQNAPYYLTYRFEPKLKENYFKEFPGNKFIHIQTLYNNKDNFKMRMCSYGSRKLNSSYFSKYEVDDLDFILITTDGIDTFPGIEDNDFIKKLINFKTLNGEFIQRRTNRIFKDFEKEKIHHLDDITIGGFSFIKD